MAPDTERQNMPETIRYTRYYEQDGMLRAHANRSMVLAMVFAVIALSSFAFAVYVRLQQLKNTLVEQPAPTVRMFLNVKRPAGNTSTDSELVAGFGYRFRTQHWPPDRALPEIYFDPRSLSIDTKQRAVLHAKCVVIDGRTAFANFTEAAQERNIEVGVLVRSQIVAERLTNFFAALIATGAVRRAL